MTSSLNGRDGAAMSPLAQFFRWPAARGGCPAADGKAPDSGRRRAPSLPRTISRCTPSSATKKSRARSCLTAQRTVAGAHRTVAPGQRFVVRTQRIVAGAQHIVADGHRVVARGQRVVVLTQRVGACGQPSVADRQRCVAGAQRDFACGVFGGFSL